MCMEKHCQVCKCSSKSVPSVASLGISMQLWRNNHTVTVLPVGLKIICFSKDVRKTQTADFLVGWGSG